MRMNIEEVERIMGKGQAETIRTNESTVPLQNYLYPFIESFWLVLLYKLLHRKKNFLKKGLFFLLTWLFVGFASFFIAQFFVLLSSLLPKPSLIPFSPSYLLSGLCIFLILSIFPASLLILLEFLPPTLKFKWRAGLIATFVVLVSLFGLLIPIPIYSPPSLTITHITSIDLSLTLTLFKKYILLIVWFYLLCL